MASEGDFGYVHYGENRRGRGLFHQRMLIGYVDGKDWVIVTPDFDVYVEDFTINDDGAQAVRFGPPTGALPAGLVATQIYMFRPVLSRARKAALLSEGQRLAAIEKARRGLPQGRGASAANSGGASADPIHKKIDVDVELSDGVPPKGWAWHCLEEMPALDLTYGDQVEVGPGASDASLHSRQGKRGILEMSGMTFFAMLLETSNRADPVGLLSEWRGSDLRVLPVKLKAGNRLRDWSAIVDDSKEHEFDDWAMDKPRTTRWCMQYLMKEGGPNLHHEKTGGTGVVWMRALSAYTCMRPCAGRWSTSGQSTR